MGTSLIGCSPNSTAVRNAPQPSFTPVLAKPSPQPTSTIIPSPSPTPIDPCATLETADLKNTVIAFTGKRNNTDAIYTIHGDGSQRSLLAEKGFAPAWSPDGSRVAFLLKTDRTREVHFTNADGTEETRTAAVNELHVINADGTQETTIPLEVSPIPVSSSAALIWSPDSRKLVLIGDNQGRYGMYVLNLEDKTLINLTPPTKLVFNAMLAQWSPDGQAIAFQASFDEVRGLHSQIIVTDAAGKNWHAINSEAVDDEEPHWHPQAEMILFVSREAGESAQLFTMKPDGSDRRQLTHTDIEHKASPAWSPNGGKIAYLGYGSQSGSTKTDEGLYLINSDGTHEEALVQAASNFLTLRSPQWSSESRYLAFTRGKSDIFDLYTADTCTAQVKRIAQNLSDYSPSWKP